MNWDKLFLYLGRFNTVAISCAVLALAVFLVTTWLSEASDRTYRDIGGAAFGTDERDSLESTLSGQEIVTADGVLGAYYHASDEHNRDDLGGLTLINPKTGKTLEIGTGADELVIGFDLLFDQENGKTVVGYVARIADPRQYKAGRMNLVVGALPAMNRNVVAHDIYYTDFPVLVGDDAVAAILWTEEEQAEYVSFSLSTGELIERKSIRLPMLRTGHLSMGPGTLDGSSLRDRSLSSYDSEPEVAFEFWE